MKSQKYRFAEMDDYKEIRSKLEYDEFLKLIKNQGFANILIAYLADIFGPLTVSERWTLLEQAGFGTFRQRVDLQGSSEDAARSLTIKATTFGYPMDALLVQLAINNTENITAIDAIRIEKLLSVLLFRE